VVMTPMPDAVRNRDRALTRRIKSIEREGVLLAGRTFDPMISEADLKAIEARLTCIDDSHEKLLEERASLRRTWCSPHV
jgi:hypothetical protein